RMVAGAVEAARTLESEGISAKVWDMRWVKPVDADAIATAAASKLVVTVEEGVLAGGVGEAVAADLAREDASCDVLTLGIPDEFVTQGKPAELLHMLGLDAEGIVASVRARLGH
ncbi:MAG: 1-deoxy-D-xylulose-5-phosphate synthase, partial [Eggerthellaceae bacterium]|nr:1-deoxy-D-xylulose-5-phosphate synthase [Eggerthellaceae bacterium]